MIEVDEGWSGRPPLTQLPLSLGDLGFLRWEQGQFYLSWSVNNSKQSFSGPVALTHCQVGSCRSGRGGGGVVMLMILTVA